MELNLIAALGKNNEIGKNNDLLWHLPNDMKFFKSKTQNSIVIMGRKNWLSIPDKYRPLPNRDNVVLSKNTSFKADGAKVFNDFKDVVDYCSSSKNPSFIIGGAQIYDLALKSNLVKTMYLTHVDSIFDADTFFPEFNNDEWNTETILNQPKDEKHPFAFTVKKYTYKK